MTKARRGKRDVDQAKKERAARKRERRERSGDAVPDDGDAAGSPVPEPRSQQEVLAALDLLHSRFAAEAISFDEFEATKTALLDELAGT